MPKKALLAAATLAAFLLFGCGQEQVTVYTVPKEEAPASPVQAEAPSSMASVAVPTADGLDLTWQAPATWVAKPPAPMRKASFTVGGAELSVTAFPGDVGGELANVNRWRGQVGLKELSAGQLEGAVRRLQVNGLNVTLVEISAGSDKAIIGAIVAYSGSTWFFKLSGSASAVAGARDSFMAFVNTLKAR